MTARLETVPRTFSLLGCLSPTELGTRRVRHLTLDQLRPSIRFCHSCPVEKSQPEYVLYDYQLIYLGDSQGNVVIDAIRYNFSENSAFLIPPFVRHTVNFERPGRMEVMSVHFDMAPGFPGRSEKADHRAPYEILLQGGLQLPVWIKPESRIVTLGKMKALLNAWKERTDLGGLKAESLLLELLVDAMREPGESVSKPPRSSLRTLEAVRRVTDHIAAHYAEALPPARLTEVSGLSRSHFNRSFRATLGYAPSAYLHHVRMKAASRLLEDASLTIKEVAYRVGYEDPYHFSKAFRRYDGLSPSQFRQTFLRENSFPAK